MKTGDNLVYEASSLILTFISGSAVRRALILKPQGPVSGWVFIPFVSGHEFPLHLPVEAVLGSG